MFVLNLNLNKFVRWKRIALKSFKKKLITILNIQKDKKDKTKKKQSLKIVRIFVWKTYLFYK